MNPVSTIEINLSRLDHNLGVIRRLIGPEVHLGCVIKADAYGLGAPRIARRLEQGQVDLLAVYTQDQAQELVKSGITLPILILMPVREIRRMDLLYRPLISGRLHCVVHDASHLADLQKMAEQYACEIPIHIEIDTGMSRGGLAPDEAAEIIKKTMAARYLRLAGVFTHFASAHKSQETTNRQFTQFVDLIRNHVEELPPECVLHAANTHAMMRDPEYHLDMVRIGLAWAGYGVEHLEGEPHLAPADDLLPIMRWKSHIVHIKTIESGTSVGYGETWTAKRPTVLGLVPVGYADGYPLSLSNKGVVCVRSATGWWPAPVVGQVSMDQLTVDLTEIAEGGTIGVGSEVELIGNTPDLPTHLPTLAAQAGVSIYAFLTGLNLRIPRDYRFEATHVVVTDTAREPAIRAASV